MQKFGSLMRTTGISLPANNWSRPKRPFSCREKAWTPSNSSLRPYEPGKKEITFLFLGRLIGQKGIYEFVQAARLLQQKGLRVKCQLLGFFEENDPLAISRQQIEEWTSRNIVTYLGHTDHVVPIMEQADCIVLASYRGEGMPLSLLEGASMCKTLIAADTAGCRSLIADGVNGYLCHPKDGADLAAKMMAYCHLPDDAKKQMGIEGRNRVLANSIPGTSSPAFSPGLKNRMHTLLFILYSLLCGVAIVKMPFIRNSGIRPTLLLLLFALHVATGIAHNFIAYRYYPEHGDIWDYFWKSFMYRHRLVSDFATFVADNASWTHLSHNGLIYIQMILNLFSFDHLDVNTLLFSFPVFLGNIALFRVFRHRFPNDPLTAFTVFLLPSVLFWTSCIHREGILYMLLGFLLLDLHRMMTSSYHTGRLMRSVFCFLLIFYFRSGFALAFLPAAFVWWYLEKKQLRPTIGKDRPTHCQPRHPPDPGLSRFSPPGTLAAWQNEFYSLIWPFQAASSGHGRLVARALSCTARRSAQRSPRTPPRRRRTADISRLLDRIAGDLGHRPLAIVIWISNRMILFLPPNPPGTLTRSHHHPFPRPPFSLFSPSSSPFPACFSLASSCPSPALLSAIAASIFSSCSHHPFIPFPHPHFPAT